MKTTFRFAGWLALAALIIFGTAATYQTGSPFPRLADTTGNPIRVGAGLNITNRWLYATGTGGGGTGTVTSVGLTMPGGFSVSGSPVTTSGTLAVTTALTNIIKGTGSGFTNATAGVDYQLPGGSTPQLYVVSDESAQFALGGLKNGDVVLVEGLSTVFYPPAYQADLYGQQWLLVDSTQSANASGWAQLGTAIVQIYFGGTQDIGNVYSISDYIYVKNQGAGGSFSILQNPALGITSIEAYSGSLDGTFTNLNIFAPTLGYLDVSGNLLTEFDCLGLTNVTQLFLSGNLLSSVDATDLIALQEWDLNGNLLTSFSCSNCVSLFTLWLGDSDQDANLLTVFDPTGLDNLQSLILANNRIESFIATNLTSLTSLDIQCGYTPSYLKSFNGNGLTALTSLTIVGNESTLTNFTSGDLLSLPSFTINNFTNLSILNISGWTTVTNLSVTNAALTSASVNNTLTNLAFFGLPNGLVALEGGTSSTTNAAGDAAVQTLRAAGWNVSQN